jgi:hypothetical protein
MTPEHAADAAWAMTSVSVWENLTVERGWSTTEYVSRMQTVLKQVSIKT